MNTRIGHQRDTDQLAVLERVHEALRGFEVEGERTDTRARATLVLVNHQWRIAHEHFSPFKSNP